VARGERVRALVRRKKTDLESLQGEFVLGDVRDAAAVEAACRGVDVVHHVAAVAGVWGPWKHYFDTNVTGTQNVIRACQRTGVKRLVFTSSPSVTFAGRDQCGVDESAPYAQKWRSPRNWFWRPMEKTIC